MNELKCVFLCARVRARAATRVSAFYARCEPMLLGGILSAGL